MRPTIAVSLWPIALVHLVLGVISGTCAGTCSTCHTVLKDEGRAKLTCAIITTSSPNLRELLQHAVFADKGDWVSLSLHACTGLLASRRQRPCRATLPSWAGLCRVPKSTFVPRLPPVRTLTNPQHSPKSKIEGLYSDCVLAQSITRKDQLCRDAAGTEQMSTRECRNSGRVGS